MAEFHLKDGFTYERVSESGDVRIRYRHVAEVTVPENEWASVLASVSAGGEDAVSWQRARHLHADVAPICGVGCNAGRYGEPLACGLPAGHDGAHAWASLPTWTDGQETSSAS